MFFQTLSAFATDPFHPQSNEQVIDKLQRATVHSTQLVKSVSIQRIFAGQPRIPEIYIIFDISEDVMIDLIRSSIKFAEDRILAVSKEFVFCCNVIDFHTTRS